MFENPNLLWDLKEQDVGPRCIYMLKDRTGMLLLCLGFYSFRFESETKYLLYVKYQGNTCSLLLCQVQYSEPWFLRISKFSLWKITILFWHGHRWKTKTTGSAITWRKRQSFLTGSDIQSSACHAWWTGCSCPPWCFLDRSTWDAKYIPGQLTISNCIPDSINNCNSKILNGSQ